MRSILLTLLTAAMLASFIIPVSAEEAKDSSETNPLDDTLLYLPGGLLKGTSSVTNPTDFEHKLTQNPTVALFKSMVVPGWGQYGNHKYIKGTLFFAADVWFISRAFKYRKDARDYWSRYEGASSIAEKNSLYSQYKTFKNKRNKFTWFAVITSFVSMFDAYVDAHLSGYPGGNTNKDVTISVGPQASGGVRANLSVSF
jgi:hypothetical protein